MIIYIDLYFAITFMADYLSLIIASRILKRRLPLLRAITALLLASTVASIGVLLSAPYVLQLLLSGVMLISASIIIFKAYSIREVLLDSAIILSVGIFIGGALEGIAQIAAMLDFRSNISVVMLCLLFSIISIAALRKILSIPFSPTTCKIEVKLKERSYTFSALIDTGSFLKEPITQRPIILVSEAVYEKLSPSADATLKAPVLCVGLGGTSEVTIFVCGEILITYKKFTFLSNAILGYPESSTNKFSDYDAIVPNAAIMLDN